MSNHLCVSAAEFKVILDRDRVLCYHSASVRIATRRVGSEFISKLYTIRKIYPVQHSTVYIILT